MNTRLQKVIELCVKVNDLIQKGEGFRIEYKNKDEDDWETLHDEIEFFNLSYSDYRIVQDVKPIEYTRYMVVFGCGDNTFTIGSTAYETKEDAKTMGQFAENFAGVVELKGSFEPPECNRVIYTIK